MFTKLVIIYAGGNFKLLKHHVFYFDVIGFAGMEEDPSPPAPAASKFEWSSLAVVTSDSLDPQKTWYVLTKELCGGVRPSDFSRNSIFSIFPDEVKLVVTRELKHVNSARWNRQPRNMFVASSFGLCAGLLRQREIPPDGLISSPCFQSVLKLVNSITFDLEPSNMNNINSGGKTRVVDLLAQRQVEIESLEAELKTLHSRIIELESQINERNPAHSWKLDSLSLESTISSGSPSETSPSSSPASIEDTKNSPLGSTTKKRRIASQCREVMLSLNDVSERYRESICSVLGNTFLFGNDTEKEQVRDTISEVVDMVMDAKGSKRGLSELLSSSTYQRIIESMRVPDWALLYFKLQTRLPDSAWQTLLNLTQLGKSGRAEDTPVLLTKNEIKAVKKLVFTVVRKTLKITKMDTDFDACDVDLSGVLVWAIREQRLFSSDTDDMEFNIKLDGRPLGGKDQVAVGVAPIDFSNKSSESALSIYPLAIANCKEKRGNLKQLIRNLNCQKNQIKKHGIVVDGKKYSVKFTVTLDYKALCLLLNKKSNEDFVLGGKGYGSEFCSFCDAIRACTSHGADPDEACLDCLRSKANIGRCSGLRDDLNFLLEEDLCNINLCSLHCEMRNCEQLLGSLGLFAYRIGSLDRLNEVLSNYGPENCRGSPRITIKERKGQQTAIEKHNIQVASFSGSTEREILKNFEEIVETSLPLEKLKAYYEECAGSAKQVVLDYVTFFEQRKSFIADILESGVFLRDHGSKQEKVNLEDKTELKSFLEEHKEYWAKKLEEVEEKFLELDQCQVTLQGPKQKKRKRSQKKPQADVSDNFSKFAAELQIEFFLKVCCDWRGIALTMRDKVFKPEDDELIDIHDIKCKEWGFLLKKLFGQHLGTGDYGHLVVDHSAMLLRQFRSMYKYSGQGFESSHKLHRQLYSKATNHDSSGPGQSLNQILTHWYATMLLCLRYAFHQASDCIYSGKKKFSYRGCGWKGISTKTWSEETKKWILTVNGLFNQMFGSDYLSYSYDKDHGTHVTNDVISRLREYDHDYWECEYAKYVLGSEKNELPLSEGTSDNFCTPGAYLNRDYHFQPDAPPKLSKQPSAVNLSNCLQKGSNTDISQPTPMDVSFEIKQSDRTPTDVKKEDSVTEELTFDSGSDLRVAIAEAKTRAEEAALFTLLPPVSRSSASVLQPVYGEMSASDPFTLKERPCESDIEKAQMLLVDQRKNGMHPSGVRIGGTGQFSEDGLSILKKFCSLAATKWKVSSEASWLSQLKCSVADLVQIQDALWHHSATTPILRFRRKSIDVISFSELTGERYIDSFVIDICIGKYLEEARENGNDDTLYFPSEFYDWMKSSDRSFKQTRVADIASDLLSLNNLQQILVPVHLPNHWGLSVVDVANMEMYFDDGLARAAPSTALPSIKELLDLLCEMHPSHPTLQRKFWQHCTYFKRFGMPSQEPVDHRMIGTGSCGIGVIMAANDFIYRGSSCINKFQWRFSEMDIHRKNLMLQILNWRA